MCDVLSTHPTAEHSQTPSAPTIQLRINGEQYLARPYMVLGHLINTTTTLATVIRVEPGTAVDRDLLKQVQQRYNDDDDVFCNQCLRAVFFQGATQSELKISQDARELFAQWETMHIDFLLDDISPGPYYVAGGQIFQLYKVHDDFNHAFTVSCLPSLEEPSSWQDGRLTGSSFTCLGVAVPSRLYFQRTKIQPLNGVRIAVKDVFHMKGVKTSCCSRAFHDLYDMQPETARCLERLVDQGVQLVGKTHLSSFAWREEPTECVDYQAPFNPRGDRYQSPAGSSSGSGSAIASYDWLDFSLGTDTTGSGRRPALWNGCFAIRPSAGTLDCHGMVPTCPKFDIPSIFGRDISAFKTLMLSWFDRPLAPETHEDKPWTIVWPTDYLDVANVEQLKYIRDFSEELSTYLGAGDLEMLSIAGRWEETHGDGQTLDEFMPWVQEHGFYYDAYHCFDNFRDDYQQKYQHRPYISPPTEWMWGIAALISEGQRDEAMKRFETFRLWFLQHIMKVNKRNTLVILPIETLEPRYRDVPPPPAPTRPPKGMNVLFLSPTLGSPELVVPMAHWSYNSRITDCKESLPVAVSIMAAPDMDVRLVELVEAFLRKTGKPTRVSTGKTMF